MTTIQKLAAKYVEFQKYNLDYQEQGDYEMAQIFYNRTREIVSIVNIINEHVEFWKELERIRENP